MEICEVIKQTLALYEWIIGRTNKPDFVYEY